MASRRSAGLLMYRERDGAIEVLLAHPGGPLFAKKDLEHWTIPKGEYDDDEDPLEAARREFAEETGLTSQPPYIALGEIRQKGGKLVRAWAFKGDCDPSTIVSNTFELEWPPKSGKMQRFPEVDRCEFFSIAQATRKIKESQIPLIEALQNAR
ncbi:MAG TPA: NUDIX domain-containing protein [Phycisphaerales bacterium]|nr:NUDIX domain-containing protein [Phycisphaerales bacterium]